jgi:hypothetical protein
MAGAVNECMSDVKRCAEQLGHAGDDASSAEQFSAAVAKLRTACAEQCDSSSSARDPGSLWGAVCAIWVRIA